MLAAPVLFSKSVTGVGSVHKLTRLKLLNPSLSILVNKS